MNLNLKKLFLYVLIASVAISAAVGIVVLLIGNFGELESKVLMTTTTITVTSILGLACGAYFETGRGKVLPLAGICFAVVSAILWIVLIWGAFRNEELYLKIVGTSVLLAVACSLLSLISIAVLDRRFRWSRHLVHICVWLLSAILLWLIWFEPDPQGDLVPRVIGVLSIIIASLTITTPVFHKLSQAPPDERAIDEEIGQLKKRLAELERQKAAFCGQDSATGPGAGESDA